MRTLAETPTAASAGGRQRRPRAQTPAADLHAFGARPELCVFPKVTERLFVGMRDVGMLIGIPASILVLTHHLQVSKLGVREAPA